MEFAGKAHQLPIALRVPQPPSPTHPKKYECSEPIALKRSEPIALHS